MLFPVVGDRRGGLRFQQHRAHRIEYAAYQFGGGHEHVMCLATLVKQLQSTTQQCGITGSVVAFAGTAEIITLPGGCCLGYSVFRRALRISECAVRKEQQWLIFGGEIGFDQAAQSVAQLIRILRAHRVQ
jgi:hypothetical protein